MHEGLFKPAKPRSPAFKGLFASANGPRRLVVLASVAITLALLLAWFDGGEEPIRAIAQPVALPDAKGAP